MKPALLFFGTPNLSVGLSSHVCRPPHTWQPSHDYPSLLLHLTPTATGAVAGVLRKRTLLTVIQTLGGSWWRVRWHNKEAW